MCNCIGGVREQVRNKEIQNNKELFDYIKKLEEDRGLKYRIIELYDEIKKINSETL